MHNAPAVCYPVGRSRLQMVLWLLLSLNLLVWLMWWWLEAALRWSHLLMAVLVLWVAFWGWRVLQQTPSGHLQWTGQQWQWQANPAAQVDGANQVLDSPLHVVWDLQAYLVLQVRHGRAVQWLWLQQSAQPERWHALRCAVFARVHSTPDALLAHVADTGRGAALGSTTT